MTTNLDEIRQMTSEELAEFFTDIPDLDLLQCKMCLYMAKLPDGTLLQCVDEETKCKEGILRWFEQEVEE